VNIYISFGHLIRKIKNYLGSKPANVLMHISLMSGFNWYDNSIAVCMKVGYERWISLSYLHL